MGVFSKDNNVAVSVEKKQRQPKTRRIPKNVEGNFTDDDKKLYAQNVKKLTLEERKKYFALEQKILLLQQRKIKRQLEKLEQPDWRLLTYAKCIFAEEILTLKPELLKDLLGKEFTPRAAKALDALAKKHNQDLQFKVKEKVLK